MKYSSLVPVLMTVCLQPHCVTHLASRLSTSSKGDFAASCLVLQTRPSCVKLPCISGQSCLDSPLSMSLLKNGLTILENAISSLENAICLVMSQDKQTPIKPHAHLTAAGYFCFLYCAADLTLWYIFIIYKICIYSSNMSLQSELEICYLRQKILRVLGHVPAASESQHRHLGSMNSSTECEHILETGGKSGSMQRD